MEIINLNPENDIGASAWFLEIDDHRLLMDAGTHPKKDGLQSLPKYGAISGRLLDSIAITHCHHDHIGSLPVAMRENPQAHVLMTEMSYFIVERVLHNSVNVMKRQRDELGIKEYPLYSHREVDELAPIFQGFRYRKEIEWAATPKTLPGEDSPTLEFFDAGHALGSAGVLVKGKEQSVFYTGDVCFQDQTILKGAQFDDVKADVLIMETTRGNRDTPDESTRPAELERLIVAINEVQAAGGCVLIPSFALGRTQEMLAALANSMADGKLRTQPVYIGGLGRVFTEIYDLESHRISRNQPDLHLNEALQLIVIDPKKAAAMKLKGCRLFVITAGMLSENTAAHVLAARMMEDERHAIFFVGYADPSTPGGRLREAKLNEPFFYSETYGEISRKCRSDQFDLTAHANRGELLDFVGRVDPHTVLLGHGDDDSRDWFEAQIKARHPKIRVIQPPPGESIKA
jgi:Cft2 family RNA processing exonuclease